ncbi:MAG: GAF domain-containing protein [Marmoricola sp.]
MTPKSDSELPSTVQAMLDAVIAISSDLDQRSVLTRIVEAACQLTGAQYAALGVIGPDGTLIEFVTTGLSESQHELIGELPHGKGILGLLIHQPRAIRLPVLSEHPDSVGFPPNHPPMTTFLGVPVRIRGTVFGNLYLTEKAGGVEFTKQDELLVGALASAAGFVIENARAYGLSERRRQWLEASAALADALQPPIDLERALRLITQGARSVSGATAAAVLSFRYDAARTVTADPVDGERVAAALDEVLAISRSGPDIRTLDLKAMTALVIPLRAHLAGHAALVALFEAGLAPPDVEERELLAAFADQAALALDRAQALVDREELAVISDRERIARDLHDVVIQRLFATGLQLQGAARFVIVPEVNERLERAVTDLDQTIRDIRGTIFELQQQRLGSLRGELRSLVREYVPVLGYTPAVRTSGPVDTAVPDRVREQLLPVLREALSNLARHARASYAEVVVHVTATELRLSVLDDGVGLAADRTESGLRNARRRATTLGGSLELEDRATRGTSFTWRVPLG